MAPKVAVLLHVTILMVCFIKNATGFTLTATNNGDWEVKEEVNLQCVNTPYSGVHEWIYGSTVAARCGLLSCEILFNNGGKFSFDKLDRTNGIFIWSIAKIDWMYDAKRFGCFNGTKTLYVTANIYDRGLEALYILVISLVVGIWLALFLGLLLCVAYTNHEKLHLPVVLAIIASILLVVPGVLILIDYIKRTTNDAVKDVHQLELKPATDSNETSKDDSISTNVTDKDVHQHEPKPATDCNKTSEGSKQPLILIAVTISVIALMVAGIVADIVVNQDISSVVENLSKDAWLILVIILVILAVIYGVVLVWLWSCARKQVGLPSKGLLHFLDVRTSLV